MRYQSPSQVGTWNGWTEPVPPPPSLEAIRDSLIKEIDWELEQLPIRQQTVIVAVCHVEEDAWTVDILNHPPERGPYDGWEECLIDFDQYHDSIEANRYDTAKVLAYELMNKVFPGWQDPHYGKPEPPDREEDWH